MPFVLWEGDLTRIRADAIVNAANSSLLGGGGVDGAIHRAAGPELLEACRKLGGCETGKAKLTEGFRMRCKYIIHTVGPVWRGGQDGEAELLASCYRESLKLAESAGCTSVAFPLISSGAYGYPRKEAWIVARDTIRAYLDASDADMTVTMAVLSRNGLWEDPSLEKELRARLTPRTEPEAFRAMSSERLVARAKPPLLGFGAKASVRPNAMEEVCDAESFPQLDERLRSRDESFSEMLLRKIDEAGMTDAQCYRSANIDRKLFSKIRSDRLYRPSKQTAVAFAFALRLDERETRDLLLKAGYALSGSATFDLIILYFLEKKEYNLMTVNEALFRYDQPLLGGR